MIFNIDSAVRRLTASAAAIRSLVSGLETAEAVWKPWPEKWSILEVVNHLADEEVEDFRARLDLLIHRPAEEFAPIDPQGWVTSRRYVERDLEDSLARYLKEREHSIQWLTNLVAPDLERGREHPVAGFLTGRQMLASWVAHDLLHVRQITRLRYQYLEQRVEPLSIEYAGGW